MYKHDANHCTGAWMAKNSAAAVILLIAGMGTIRQSKARSQLQRTLQRPLLCCIVIVFDVHKLCGQRGISQVLAQSMPGDKVDKYQKHTTETVCAVTSCCFFKTRTPSPTCSNVTPPEPPST